MVFWFWKLRNENLICIYIIFEAQDPVNGGWGPWEEVSPCSASCGGGNQTLARQCNNPVASNGGSDCENSDTDSIKTVSCNTQSCDSK